MHEKFLKQVADYYLRKYRAGACLGDYTMVLPNMRSAMFLHKYIIEGIGKRSAMMPKLITITAFTQQFSADMALASPTELLFILYEAYAEVLGRMGRSEQIPEFDAFIFWGNALLEDFDDIDSCLVDSRQLFTNVKKQLEIQSTYLTESQAEVARLLGPGRPLPIDQDNFWLHAAHNTDPESAAKSFVSLWEILGDVYDEFHKRLRSRHLAYSGQLARRAYERAKQLDAADFHGNRLAFIGFYVLSPARKGLLKRLHDIGVADFFWDTASPLLTIAGSKAGSEIMPLAKAMPVPEDFELQKITMDDIAKIEICAVPSNAGQTKTAASIIKEWMKALKIEQITADDAWGLILPNDKLLAPMLSAMPEGVKSLNVAMKVPFSDTPFASLISTIIHMQATARNVHGHPCYFYKTVLDLISHPYVASIAPAEVLSLRAKMAEQHLYNLSADELAADFPGLAFIFAPVAKPGTITEAKAYLDNLIAEMGARIKRSAQPTAKTPYELKILESYTNAVEEIAAQAKAHNIAMSHNAFFTLLKRMLSSRTLEFNGDPVRGLQVLGMQDSRLLDFDNLIMLSLNERIMPRKTISPSLIPAVLRSAYGMPTVEDEEVNMAYLFYRLISRSSRVCLIYDSRPSDQARGEMSRYLRQLMMLLPQKVKLRKLSAPLAPSPAYPFSITKDEKVMDELLQYTIPGGPALSASALKTYIDCPLKFYLQNVKGLRIEDFDPEYINDASYGDIIHRVAEAFYNRYHGQWFNADLWRLILSNEESLRKYLQSLALDIMNEHYYGGRFTGMLHRMPGEGRVLSRVIANYVLTMFRNESKMAPFRFVDAEKKHKFQWTVDAVSGLTINFTMTIDRIDEKEDGTLRFIDYKTGSDALDSSDFNWIFTEHKQGAIFQLLLYALAYKDRVDSTHDIEPVVYSFKKMAKDGIKPIEIEGDTRVTINAYEDKFREGLVALISEIFDPEIPFDRCADAGGCGRCAFATLCNRMPKIDD